MIFYNIDFNNIFCDLTKEIYKDLFIFVQEMDWNHYNAQNIQTIL